MRGSYGVLNGYCTFYKSHLSTPSSPPPISYILMTSNCGQQHGKPEHKRRNVGYNRKGCVVKNEDHFGDDGETIQIPQRSDPARHG